MLMIQGKKKNKNDVRRQKRERTEIDYIYEGRADIITAAFEGRSPRFRTEGRELHFLLLTSIFAGSHIQSSVLRNRYCRFHERLRKAKS